MNKFLGIGRIGKDPEIKYSAQGLAICSFSVACSEKYKTKTGEQKEDTFWARCVAFGKLAEIISQYGHKGQQVYIEGKMQERSWEDNAGIKRYITECVLREFKMLGNKSVTQRQPEDPELPPVTSDDQLPF